MEKIKFTHKFGVKRLSVAYYEDKRLKKLKGIKKGVYPIYLQIVYDKVTLRVRSLLWQRLIESNNEFLFGVVYPKTHTEERMIVEGYADIENSFIKNKDTFHQLCEYEFDCIKRIVVFACQSQPKNVHEIVNAYSFWGQDGLREVCSKLIEQILGHEDADLKFTTRSLSARNYPPISRNLYKFIKDATVNYDPASVICLINEIELIDKLNLKGQLLDDYEHLVWLIGQLIFYSYKETSDPLSMGIYYFPKIHFYYPLSNDLSKRTSYEALEKDPIKVIDLLKFQSYLSKK